MREAFEAWAQRDGQITRRREDKPEEYLVFETQRRWLIWQAALAHGQQSAEAKPRRTVRKPASDEAVVRTRVLNEVLEAVTSLDGTNGMDGVVKLIHELKSSRIEERV